MNNFFYRCYLNYKNVKTQTAIHESTHFGNHPNQYYLVSYPKSGNTWFRFLLANLLQQESDPETLNLKNIWRYVPDIGDGRQREYLFKANSFFYHQPYQFIKTHEAYMPYFKDKQVIYMVRDGRDVINSYYYYLNTRKETPIQLMDLIKRNKDISMGTWSDHVVGWNRGKCKRKMIIRYEDLIIDTFGELERLADFCDWQIDDERIHVAIENSSFDNLRRVEEQYGGMNKVKMGANSTPFFRKGEVGDWTNTFSASDLKAFWKLNSKGMRELGYISKQRI